MILRDRYRLQHPLGAGGSGQVWQAVDQTLEREVAVKIATSVADDPQAAARFTAEARKLARLHHRNIVTVHDAGTVPDDGHQVPFLVMELLAGTTWRQRASVEQTVRTGAHLADALAHMHGRGIVHRDVKPANIMIGADGGAVLTDLGTARDFSSLATVTAAVPLGTLAYMAPEQLAGEPATAACDVYALGLVLVEKLTGKRGPAAQLSAADRDAIAPRLRVLLDRMTALDPATRPSAAECRSELAQSSPSEQPAPTGQLPPTGHPAPGGHPAPVAYPVPAYPVPVQPGADARAPGRRQQWERFGPPVVVFVLLNVSSDVWAAPADRFGFNQVGTLLVWLVRLLEVGLPVCAAVLTPRSRAGTRALGYAVAACNAAGFCLAVTLGPGPTLAHNLPLYCTALLLSIASYCYRDVRTRRARTETR